MGVLSNPKAFAHEISKGLQTLTMAHLKAYSDHDLKSLLQALDAAMREIRSEQIRPDDSAAMKDKNQRLMRLTSASSVVRGYCKQKRIVL